MLLGERGERGLTILDIGKALIGTKHGSHRTAIDQFGECPDDLAPVVLDLGDDRIEPCRGARSYALVVQPGIDQIEEAGIRHHRERREYHRGEK